MPEGRIPDISSVSPVSGLVSVMVAETSVVLSESVIATSLSTTGTGDPFSVNIPRELVPGAPVELSASRSRTGAMLLA
jgi:hypothetical protein